MNFELQHIHPRAKLVKPLVSESSISASLTVTLLKTEPRASRLGFCDLVVQRLLYIYSNQINITQLDHHLEQVQIAD